KMNRDRLAILADIETLEAAILEASRRVEDEAHSVRIADEASKARRGLEIAGNIQARARKLDEMLAAVAGLSNDLRADIRMLNHQLGCSYPHEFQLQTYGALAVKAALMFSAFKIEHLPPKDRYSFTQLSDGWRAQIERWAEAKLPQTEAAE